MRRQTPMLAIILAPIVLVAIYTLWKSVLGPVSVSVWRSDTVLKMRFASADPDRRVAALRDAARARPVDEEFVARVLAAVRADPDRKVRAAAVNVVGQIGAAQRLPGPATDALAELLMSPDDEISVTVVIDALGYASAHNRPSDEVVSRIAGYLDEPYTDWERTTAAGSLARIAEHRSLPTATLDRLAAALREDSSGQVRAQAVHALARSAGEYPAAEALLSAAKDDPRPEVSSAAAVGLRLIAHDRAFAGRDPLTLATDRSQPTDRRLDALRIIRSTTIEQTAYGELAALARDDEPRIAVAALELFHYMARSPRNDFDQQVLIPELTRAMSHTEAEVREAAVGAVSSISVHRPDYQHASDAIAAALQVGASDPDARVRVVALAAMMRGNPGSSERAAILERGLTDADPYVRRQVVSWLGAPRGRYPDREAWLERLLEDPAPDVRTAARSAQQEWSTRKRSWPIESWRLLRAGEYEQVGMSALIAITVAAPVLIGGIFLLYYMARLLTYALRSSWRAVAAVGVIGVWATASYGMFFLYFAVGNAGLTKRGDMLLAAAILWGVISLYAGLGWGMHYAIRR